MGNCYVDFYQNFIIINRDSKYFRVSLKTFKINNSDQN